MKLSTARSVAIAGAAAIGAGLTGLVALPHASHPPTQTRAVALTSGGADIYLPDLSEFHPTVADGFPPFERFLQGPEDWNLLNPPSGVEVFLFGTDSQTTIGSFVNDDFIESGGDYEGVNSNIVVPDAGSEFDLMNFGGGFENEWADVVDNNGGHTTIDTIITPFGNYTIPLGATAAQAGAAVPAEVVGYSFTDFLNSIQHTMSAGEGYLTQAATEFSEGAYLLGVSDALAGFGDLTAGEQADLLVNGYSFLVDSGGNAGFTLSALKAPADLADALSQAQEFASQGQSSLTTALSELAAGEWSFGLGNLAGVGIDSTYASDEVILGLTESLLGAVLPD